MAGIVAKLISDSVDRSVLHRYVLCLYMFFASQPALNQINDFGFKNSFTFHAAAWFPLAVMLNILFPTKSYLPEMRIVKTMAMLSFSFLCTIFTFKISAISSPMINKCSVMSMINLNCNSSFYFWSMVVANSHVIVALFFIDLTERQDDCDGACIKNQVTWILLISPFLTSEGAQWSATLYRLCGMGIIVLLCVLPWIKIGREFRIRIFNLASAYFLVFLLLVYQLNNSPVYSLISCLKFILLCSFFVFYEETAQMKRDVVMADLKTHLEDTVEEEESQPIVIPFKITQLQDPVLVSSEPTSLQIISLEHTHKSTWGSYSRGMVSEVHKFEIDEEEEQEAVHEAELVPMNIAGFIARYMPDCISYCSLFPADYEFTRDIMVWYWMASEIVKPNNNYEMDEVGIKCFDTLVARKFIVLSGYDSLSDQMTYKLGNSDDAFFKEQYFRLQYRKNLDNYTNLEELEHLSLISKQINQDHFEILKKCNNLKTLLFHKCDMPKLEKSLNGLFLRLKLLTTLDLSCTNIAELSSSVENLSSLKCLNLSRTPVRWLPVSIQSLSNLKTLILLGCRSLHVLPRGMSKLTNLQHLSVDTRLLLNAMPTGMGRLTKLQSLRAFPVGRKDGNGIEELRGMNKLKGSLSICKLENILNEDEAEMALLCDKQLNELEFLWSDRDLEDATVTIEEEILENLRPHIGLQTLKIGFFNGRILPSWVSNSCFAQMANITLSWCRYCEMLPTLGELPSLKFLSMFEMDGVVDIDIFFCRKLGNEDIPAFPRLEKLSIEGMSNLVKWTGVEDHDFASLVHLAIKHCPKLVSLPCMSHLKTLRHLEISYCDELGCLPEIGGSVVVKGCSKLERPDVSKS